MVAWEVCSLAKTSSRVGLVYIGILRCEVEELGLQVVDRIRLILADSCR